MENLTTLASRLNLLQMIMGALLVVCVLLIMGIGIYNVYCFFKNHIISLVQHRKASKPLQNRLVTQDELEQDALREGLATYGMAIVIAAGVWFGLMHL